MSDNTIISQGFFTSTGASKTLILRSDVDWVSTINMTQSAAGNINTNVQGYWQRGMAINDGLSTWHAGATQALSSNTFATAAVPGFTLVDSTLNAPLAPVATTALTLPGGNVVRVLTGTTTGLAAGSVIRLNNIAGAAQWGGVDFVINAVNAGVSFDINLANNGGTAPNNSIAVAAAGFYQIVPFDSIFYPRRRVITNITQAANAVVTTSIPHGLTVGQMVRITMPPVPGAAATMSQINGLLGEVTAVGGAINGQNTTFTLNIDSTGFTAFAYPLTDNAPFTPPYMTPVGEGTDATIADPNLLDDGTINTGYIGIILGGGALSPAGANADVIFWRAGKSFSTVNQ